MRENCKSSRKNVKAFAKQRYANVDGEANGAKMKPLNGIGDAHELRCTQCEYTCMTVQQLNLHLFKAHGIKNQWKLYVGDYVHCPVCLKLFWTRERVLNHVRYRSKVCRGNLVLRGPKYTSEEIDAMDREDTALNIALQSKGKRRHYVENPTVQLCGPIAPIMLLSKESTHHRMGFGHNLG